MSTVFQKFGKGLLLWGLALGAVGTLVLLMISILSSPVERLEAGEQVLITNDPMLIINLAPFSQVRLEPDDGLSIQTLLAEQEEDKWIKNESSAVSGTSLDGYPSGDVFYHKPVWVRTRLANQSGKDGIWRVDLRVGLLNDIQVYTVSDNRNVQNHLNHNSMKTFRDRPVQSQRLAADIPMSAEESVDLYIRYVGQIDNAIYPTLSTLAVHLRRTDRDLAIFIGALVLIGLVSVSAIILAGAEMWKSSAIFVLFTALSLISLTLIDARALPLLPDIMEIRPMFIEPVLSTISWSMAIVMMSYWFESHKSWKGWVWLIIPFLALTLYQVIFLTGWNLGVFEINNIGYSIWAPLAVILLITIFVLAIKDKKPGARFGFVLFMALVASMTVIQVAFREVFDHETVPRYRIQYIIFIPSLILSFTLLYILVRRAHAMRRRVGNAIAAEQEAKAQSHTLSRRLSETEADYQRVQKQSERQQARLSAISHDLLQPLTALRVAIERDQSEDQARKAQMRDALDYLELLASDQLRRRTDETPSIQTAEMIEDIPLAEVLNTIAAMFGPEADAKGLSFTVAETDYLVRSSPVHLLRMVSNLVSNAIKHTEAGHISVALEEQSRSVIVKVSDTGEGMTPEALQHALCRYGKGDASNGHGLGLSIVQDVSERLAYDFKITSEPGVGTEASITVPLAPSSDINQEQTP